MNARNQLSYVGIMTNYICSAACRHCMYCSSGNIPGEFISEKSCDRIADALASAGVTSLHIGGGEPFLDFDALCLLVKALTERGVGIEYIETNASWCVNDQRTRGYLNTLDSLGARCVMVSVDPFHIEFVPLERPLRLIKLLREMGMEYFVWQERFLRRLMPLDHEHALTHSALKAALGDDYVEKTAREYGLGVNGRAMIIAHELYPSRDPDDLASGAPCDLLSSMHCHIDLYENVVPPGCPGIAVDIGDFLRGDIDGENYPVVSRLIEGGTRALLSYARAKGYDGNGKRYISKCELCYALRAYLKNVSPSKDISPDCYYESMERAYNEKTVNK